MNIYEYASPLAEELPQDFVQNILTVLNQQQDTLKRYRKMASFEGEQVYRDKQNQIKGMILLLDRLGLHACYDIPGHRGEYCFPTFEDCEMWEDWMWQCADYDE